MPEFSKFFATFPLRVGLVGTGYAAKLRADTFTGDERSRLVAVAGHGLSKTIEFSSPYAAEAVDDWRDLISRDDIDIVVIATINRDHGAIARAALQADKHVIVEYPLSLDVAEAEALLTLAASKNKLLHVEHIELLSGIHLAAAAALPKIGAPFYVRYSNLNPQRPAPQKWTYQLDLFGFPLVGALSRIHRLIDLFGQVNVVSCQARFWDDADLPSFYTSCLCSAQLRFASGLIAEVIYGKGEALWQAERSLLVHGEQGALLLDGEQGTLIRDGEVQSLDMGSRRGLFAKDTTMVLDHLEKGTPLYIAPSASVYALRVADAARRSAETGQSVEIL